MAKRELMAKRKTVIGLSPFRIRYSFDILVVVGAIYPTLFAALPPARREGPEAVKEPSHPANSSTARPAALPPARREGS